MTSSELDALQIMVEPSTVDEDQFVSIWNSASASMNGDTTNARMLASKFLGFLCKQRCDFVVASPTDAKYLDDWYERDNSLLNDWKPESDKVDVLAQHAQVPFDAFVTFLDDHNFSVEKNYSPRRSVRVEWFTNDWNIG